MVRNILNEIAFSSVEAEKGVSTTNNIAVIKRNYLPIEALDNLTIIKQLEKSLAKFMCMPVSTMAQTGALFT